MIRISATNLESFRRWLLNEEATIEEMVAYLKRETQPSEAMLAGTAFHKILENAQYNDELLLVEQDGFKFDFNSLDCEFSLPEIRELKIEKKAVINGTDVTFVCVVDTIHLKEISDHKLTYRADAENYIDSMQWRCCLDWFDADKFTYNLFQQYKPANQDIYQIKNLLQVTFCRYPNMRIDIENISAKFVDFVKNHVPELIK